MIERVRRLREEMAVWDLDAFLVTDILNVRYLSHFTGTHAVLFISGDAASLLTDSRYIEQVGKECPEFAVCRIEQDWIYGAFELVRDLRPDRIGFESRALSYHQWATLAADLPGGELIPTENLVEDLRLIKDQEEIAAIREACNLADAAYEHIAEYLKPGLRETDIAVELECAIRRAGADREAFDSIVASGWRSALPHGTATSRMVAEGDLVTMDFGARLRGYNSDITRTVVLGAPDARQEEIYEIVLEAQLRAIDAIRPGLAGKDVDAVARDYIESRGYGEYFGHGLGHGLGLAVHDSRVFSKYSEIVLQPGMVVTVEPGIYIPDWGGIRIEDDVLVTESGCEVFTSAAKGLTLG